MSESARDHAQGRGVTLVVGAGGLLGSGLVRRLTGRGEHVLVPGRVPWRDEDLASEALSHALDALVEATDGGPWRVAWCAGAGVTGTPQEVLDQEVRVYERFLEMLSARTAQLDPTLGAYFQASSAGGVYAGGAQPPFTERSDVAPLAPYGRSKLVAEDLTRRFADAQGVASVIGRISNLYGPGQNLAKAQGLISQLCKADLLGQPSLIYVSLDTIRDYLFVDDAAAMVAALLDQAPHRLAGTGTTHVTKILATQRPVTIGALIGECRRVFRRRPRVVLGASPVARFQALDLRMRSVVWTDVDALATTTLAAGVHQSLLDIARGLRAPVADR